MHAVTPAGRPLLGALTVLGLAVGLAAIGAAPVAASGGGGTGGCNPYVDGTVIPVPCSSGSASSGSSGSGGGVATVHSSCTTFMLGKAQAENLGLSWPPPQGESWAIVDCPSAAIDAAPQAILVSNATDAPAIAPQQLLLTAVGQLQSPPSGAEHGSAARARRARWPA